MRIRDVSYHMGDWLAACDRCGQTFRASRMRAEWTGLRVCRSCWEPRHPQETIRGKKDKQSPVWTRPRQDGPDVSPGSGNEITEDDVI